MWLSNPNIYWEKLILVTNLTGNLIGKNRELKLKNSSSSNCTKPANLFSQFAQKHHSSCTKLSHNGSVRRNLTQVGPFLLAS